MVAAALALAPAGCSRKKDPYQDWKAPQLLDEGDRLLRAGDVATAQSVFKRGFDIAKRDGLRNSQAFVQRMTAIAASRDEVATAQGLMPVESMDERTILRLTLGLVAAGKIDEARAMAERLAPRLSAKPPEAEDLPYHVVGWIAIDRLRTQNVEIQRARAATDSLLGAVRRWVELGVPLPAAPRGWITRYVDHLFDTERSLPAQEIGDLVERIDQRFPPGDDNSPCISYDLLFPSLGCLPDWPKPK
jgi:hypothetical protein